MPNKSFDYLLADINPVPIRLRGYDWKVIIDPTRKNDDPGLFYGRLFRMIDIRLNRDEKSTWPEGIVFENVISGDQLTFQGNVLIDLTNKRVIQKKPRKRIRRKSKTLIEI